MKHILRNRLFLAISIGHTFVDILNSAMPIILATLALRLGLSNTQLGLAAMIYMLGSAVTQPLFGYAADRWGSRGLATGAVTWMAGGLIIAAFLSLELGLIVLLTVGLGSAAYHPQATMNARHASGDLATTGTSTFFLFGQVGLASGPAIAGILLSQTSLRATLLVLAAPAALVIPFLVRSVPRGVLESESSKKEKAKAESGGALRLAWPIFAAFILLIALRMVPTNAIQTFVPKLMGESGLSADWYGIALAFFMGGSAIGGVLGGYSADRWSSKGTILLTLGLAPIPLWAYLQMPLDHIALPLVIGAAGFLLGASHSILVLMAQEMMPGRMALASGLVLGFMFSAGAAGSFLLGVLADRIGLEPALATLSLITLAAAIFALPLPRRRDIKTQRQEQPVRSDSRPHAVTR